MPGRFPRTIESHPSRWAIGLILLLCLAAATGWMAGTVAERRAVKAASAAARADAQLRAALLASEVARFRLLPLALVGDRDVIAALASDAAGPRRVLNRKLEGLARATGATVIYVLDAAGGTIAASNWRTPTSFVGNNYRFRRYFSDARLGGNGAQFALGTVSGQPGLFLSRRAERGGVIVVKLEFGRIERQWAAARGRTLVANREGVILIASDPALRFATMRPLEAKRIRVLREELRLSGGLNPWMPGRDALATIVPARIGTWRLMLVQPRRTALGPGIWVARLAGAALVLAIGTAWAVLVRRRERQARARAAAMARTIELEAAVSDRTAELRQEMEERQTSEAHAATLREGLRQANRLATLGQVTASVAHETAQPVAAIRTYAATGLRLIERGDAEPVRANLEAIGRLADRIGAVTAELRGFARKGSKPIGPVPVAEVVDGARLILKERLRGIALDVETPPPDLRVLAGRVRTEQILVNLLQNAAEALEGSAASAIRLTVRADDDLVRIRVRDNGPGIAPDIAARLFTPFSTSRPNGLGLGLVIAQDIAQDMGGALHLLPGAGGACFELRLRKAP